MGTILERKRKDGTVSFQAQIVIKRAGLVHREQATFPRRGAAHAWIEKREKELSKPGSLESLHTGDPPLREVIDRYSAEHDREMGRTKQQVLRTIQATPLAALPCSRIGSAEIVAFARDLRKERQPQTVGNYLSHLSSIFSVAQPAWGYALDAEAMRSALIVLKRLKIISKSKQRDRRPTLEEMDRLMAYFGEARRRRPSSNPMQAIIAFALFSTRRQDEILRITWSDLDAEGSRVLVRDMKNPGEKIGNDVWCELPPEALAIVQTMPRTDARIFPFNNDAVSTAFTRACAVLGIDDLHFHDLRHEGVTRLFEMGRTVPLAASVSGHRSWQSLQRYTHVRQVGDRWAGWSWLKTITAPETRSS